MRERKEISYTTIIYLSIYIGLERHRKLVLALEIKKDAGNSGAFSHRKINSKWPWQQTSNVDHTHTHPG
jgi:hypothetical protein